MRHTYNPDSCMGAASLMDLLRAINQQKDSPHCSRTSPEFVTHHINHLMFKTQRSKILLSPNSSAEFSLLLATSYL